MIINAVGDPEISGTSQDLNLLERVEDVSTTANQKVNLRDNIVESL